MKIVIDIPQKYYEAIMAISPEKLTGDTVLIRYGIPLPKGHGRLIDADDLFDNTCIDEIPTIIEADKAGEEE